MSKIVHVISCVGCDLSEIRDKLLSSQAAKILAAANSNQAQASSDIPYISYRWDEDLNVAEFATKISKFCYRKHQVQLWGGCVFVAGASLIHPESAGSIVLRGQWIVFQTDGTLVGVYTEEQHKKEYELVKDLRDED